MIWLDLLGALSLRSADGHEVRSVLAQPKRLALLSYLAVEASRGFHRRDRLFAMFWPELEQTQARQALRQSLYFLRQSLGDQVLINRGAEEVALAPGAVSCDACTFTDLIGDDHLDDALALYRGDLLPGFFVADASSAFDEWLGERRSKLRSQAAGAAWKLAELHQHELRASEAAYWARFAMRLQPDDEHSLRRLLVLLDRTGDRAGALRAFAEFADRLRSEFDVDPSAETLGVIRSIRERSVALAPGVTRADSATAVIPPGAPPGHAASAVAPPQAMPAQDLSPRMQAASAVPSAVGARWARRRKAIAGASAAALIVGAAAAIALHIGRARGLAGAVPTVAVGWIQDPSGADTGATVRVFAELLSTDLARIPRLHVISHARLYDMLGQLGVHALTPSGISDAARRTGADELLEAVLSHAGDSTLHLDLRRVDLANGDVHDPRHFTGATLFELADRVTAHVAAETGLRAPERPLAAVSTTSRTAARLYEEGLRAYYEEYDVLGASRLFHAALDDDSSFAMAAYYAGVTEGYTDVTEAARDLALALRLADHASDRERLTIRAAWAELTNDPVAVASAESLTARYPDEPGAELALGTALAWHGQFLRAVPHLRRASHLDSLTLAGRGTRCQACDAYDALISTWFSADSLQAAVRTARDWTRVQPLSYRAWWKLADVLDRTGHGDSALVAEQMAERLAPAALMDFGPGVRRALRAGGFEVADALLRAAARSGNEARRTEALWWLVISLRDQGRLRDALATARQFVHARVASRPDSDSSPPPEILTVAQVLFEMGEFQQAAALFDSLGRNARDIPHSELDLTRGMVARRQIWLLTHQITALAANGDTAKLPPMIDSLSAWKAYSSFSRDGGLDHYARGLLLSARHQLRSAEREFRRALVDPVQGYSRENLELAKALVAEGRPREAIPLLRAPLAGPIEAESYYVTFTELHAALGEAYDRAGEPDSAIAEYRYVLSAWRHADPQLEPRVEAIRRRVGILAGADRSP